MSIIVVVSLVLFISDSIPGRQQTLPSFKRRRSANQPQVNPKRKASMKTWNIDIVCLPPKYAVNNVVQIPRGKKRCALAEMGLVRKIHLTSEMSEEDIMAEIRSVFAQPMQHDPQFPFTILNSTGAGSKTLTKLAVSAHFQWSAAQLASTCGQGAIYVLAEQDLQLPVSASGIFVCF